MVGGDFIGGAHSNGRESAFTVKSLEAVWIGSSEGPGLGRLGRSGPRVGTRSVRRSGRVKGGLRSDSGRVGGDSRSGLQALYGSLQEPARRATSCDVEESAIERCADSASGRGIVCLLYTSDAADDLLCVDLGGRR